MGVGVILGHEAVGTIESVGSRASRIAKPGDRVLVSCITACGTCRFCREGSYGQCLGGGGWILGHKIDGTQAEYVRVPFADTSTYLQPAGVSDEQLLMLADILPTGYEVGVLNGQGRPGRRRRRRRRRADRVVGDHGSRGCTARATWWPSTSPTAGSRRPSSSAPTSWSTTAARTRSRWCAGSPAGSEPTSPSRPSACRRRSSWPPPSPGPAGTSPTSGCTANRPTLHLEELWIKNVTITTGLVDTYSTPTLLRLAQSQEINVDRLRDPPLPARPVRGRRTTSFGRAGRDRRPEGGAHSQLSLSARGARASWRSSPRDPAGSARTNRRGGAPASSDWRALSHRSACRPVGDRCRRPPR